MNFDARHPDAIAATAHAMRGHFGLANVTPAVLGKVGETFAAGLYDLQGQLARLGTLAEGDRGAALR